MNDNVEMVAEAIWTTPLMDQPPGFGVRPWPPSDAEVHEEMRRQARAAIAAMPSEREQIVAWLRAQRRDLDGDPWNDGWESALEMTNEAIERGDHLTPDPQS